MAEKSLFWYTNGFTGDTGDGAAPYTQEEFRLFNHAWAAKNQANVGVFPGVLNELAVTGSSSPLSVDTGRAVVYGFPYWADSSVSVAVSTPSVGTTGGRVVLRANWTAQTVRAVAVLNTDGTATIPSLTQSAGSTWDMPLATFTITTGGTITLTDAREWALSGKPFKTLFVPCVGAHNATDGTYYDALGAQGVETPASKYITAYGYFQVPSNFDSAMSVKTIVSTPNPGGSGNLYALSYAYYGAEGEQWDNHGDGQGSHAAVALTAGELQAILSFNMADATVGDFVSLQLYRDGVHASDTTGFVTVLGWEVTYISS